MPGVKSKTIMYKKLLLVFISLYIGAMVLSCGNYAYPPDPDEGQDTSEIDTVHVPVNVRIDSLKVYYASIIDSVSGTLIDSVTLGSFIALWDSAYGADYYTVFLRQGSSGSIITKSVTVTKILWDSLAPNHTYKVTVQAVNVLYTGDTVLSDTSDTFAVAELYQPESPENVSVEYGNMTARVSWVPVTGVGITGYRAYLYNAYGDSIGCMDVLDTSGSVAFFTVSEDSAYKVNVVTINTIGMSRICSTFVYDMTTSQDTGFRLPYLYLSTFTTPSVDSGASTILGKGNMLGIKGGIFAMGDIWSNSAGGNGKPVHEVVVSSFYLSRSEISNKVYVQFLNDYTGLQYDTANSLTIFTLNGDTLLAPCGQFIYDTAAEVFSVSSDTAVYPVTGVHWTGAAAFCNWLSEKDYLTPCYDTSDWSFDSSANGYRLPTEAEYEYVHSAAFLGTKQRYPWGYNDIPDNYGSSATGFKKVAYFGAYFGFYDLSGNILEWCHDWSDHLAGPDSSYYTLSLQKGVVFDPYGPETGPYHVLRGGSYLMSGEKCTSAYRHVNPGSDVTGYGFRVARRHN